MISNKNIQNWRDLGLYIPPPPACDEDINLHDPTGTDTFMSSQVPDMAVRVEQALCENDSQDTLRRGYPVQVYSWTITPYSRGTFDISPHVSREVAPSYITKVLDAQLDGGNVRYGISTTYDSVPWRLPPPYQRLGEGLTLGSLSPPTKVRRAKLCVYIMLEKDTLHTPPESYRVYTHRRNGGRPTVFSDLSPNNPDPSGELLVDVYHAMGEKNPELWKDNDRFVIDTRSWIEMMNLTGTTTKNCPGFTRYVDHVLAVHAARRH